MTQSKLNRIFFQRGAMLTRYILCRRSMYLAHGAHVHFAAPSSDYPVSTIYYTGDLGMQL